MNIMHRSTLPISAIFALYVTSFVFLVNLYLDTGNRYSWMNDLDPAMSALPVDEEGQIRVVIFILGAALPSIAGLLISRSIHLRGLRIVTKTIGALLLGAALLKVHLLA